MGRNTSSRATDKSRKATNSQGLSPSSMILLKESIAFNREERLSMERKGTFDGTYTFLVELEEINTKSAQEKTNQAFAKILGRSIEEVKKIKIAPYGDWKNAFKNKQTAEVELSKKDYNDNVDINNNPLEPIYGYVSKEEENLIRTEVEIFKSINKAKKNATGYKKEILTQGLGVLGLQNKLLINEWLAGKITDAEVYRLNQIITRIITNIDKLDDRAILLRLRALGVGKLPTKSFGPGSSHRIIRHLRFLDKQIKAELKEIDNRKKNTQDLKSVYKRANDKVVQYRKLIGFMLHMDAIAKYSLNPYEKASNLQEVRYDFRNELRRQGITNRDEREKIEYLNNIIKDYFSAFRNVIYNIAVSMLDKLEIVSIKKKRLKASYDVLKLIENIKVVRSKLKENENYIFTLDKLLLEVFNHLGIGKDSIQKQIVIVRKPRRKLSLGEGSILVVSLALLPFSFGTSTSIAVAGLLLSGIDIYLALEDSKLQRQFYEVGFSSSEPSVTLLLISIALAGLELNSINKIKPVLKSSSKNLNLLQPKDRITFIQKLKETKEIPQNAKKAIIKFLKGFKNTAIPPKYIDDIKSMIENAVKGFPQSNQPKLAVVGVSPQLSNNPLKDRGTVDKGLNLMAEKFKDRRKKISQTVRRITSKVAKTNVHLPNEGLIYEILSKIDSRLAAKYNLFKTGEKFLDKAAIDNIGVMMSKSNLEELNPKLLKLWEDVNQPVRKKTKLRLELFKKFHYKLQNSNNPREALKQIIKEAESSKLLKTKKGKKLVKELKEIYDYIGNENIKKRINTKLNAYGRVEIFDSWRSSFWRKVKKDNKLYKLFKDAGFAFKRVGSNAPYLEVSIENFLKMCIDNPDLKKLILKRLREDGINEKIVNKNFLRALFFPKGKKSERAFQKAFSISIDHIKELTNFPEKIVDGANMRLLLNRENTYWLEFIKRVDTPQL